MHITNKMASYFIAGSYSFMKPEIVAKSDRHFPLMLNIEPTLACNLNCFMCPAHNKSAKQKMKRKIGFMPWDLFTKIIDECALEGQVLILNMHKDGESLLHPKFSDMLTYAKTKNAAKLIHFNTNAVFHDASLIDRILDSGVDDITLSIDAYYPETFLEVKGKNLLHQVVANAMSFFEKRAQRNLDAPYIRVKMLGTEELAEEFEQFKLFWKDIADEVQVQPIHNFAGGMDFNRSVSEQEYPCEFPFFSTAINWDGTVTFCHRDFYGQDLFGGVKHCSLRDIYTNDKYQLYLRSHIEGKKGTLPLCKYCDNWKDGPDLGSELTSRLAGIR